MNKSDKFCLNDYDCIGFDLDCTLVEYNVEEIIKLVYDLLAKFLIQKKSYESEFLLRPMEEEKFIFQKGLFMDFKKGNILKLAENGFILKACHGTFCLNEENIIEQYGPNKIFNGAQEYTIDPLSIASTSYNKQFMPSLDCFNLSLVLIFARIVDHLDKANGGVSKEYSIWPDMLDGLYYIYNNNCFATGEGGFFSALQQNPSLYYKKWDMEKILWLKDLKKKKFVFLLTGSFINFATLTANTGVGENWMGYFDVVLCHARKPFFFAGGHPFFKVKDAKEIERVQKGELLINSVYSQGNWEDLKTLMINETNIKEPKCVYIGDNFFQDVLSPVHFKCCETVAVSLELKDVSKTSEFWGSYFEGNDKLTSYWNHLMRSYAELCVSDLSVFSKRPLDFKYFSLKVGQTNDVTENNGYYIG